MITLRFGKILPAVTLVNVADALHVAGAIKEGGVQVMEVAFRSAAAGASIAVIRKSLPDMLVGAGTILNIEQLHQAKSEGAQFALSPGFNPVIVQEAKRIDFPFIPGVMTPSEIEQALDTGCSMLKLFPAVQAGGLAMLKALEGPYAHTELSFIPMGGINLQNMCAYLQLKNVCAVGGSWIATKELIEKRKFESIRKNAADALALSAQLNNTKNKTL